ncbi:MAG TPA: ABC transporter substrate-binding protein [Vicinamibacterales bacterium]|nr:ABC transporter substrate-binding protein [Vicinamibacterales bacterium]
MTIAAARCGRTGPTGPKQQESTLRVGSGQIELKQFVQRQTIEALAKVREDGRLTPWLAKDWAVSEDGLTITVNLRPGVHFQDGSEASGQVLADALHAGLPSFLGIAFDDVAKIEAVSSEQIALRLKRPSQFVLESLEVQLPKPGSGNVGTGPFVAEPGDTVTEMRANADYYGGRPSIARISIHAYPTVRAAWAEMLRNNIDMVYEVGVDALASLETTTTTRLFYSVRPYQYAILLNPHVPALQTASIRLALNAAIDRSSLVRDALDGHGLASAGPVWPKNWAFSSATGNFTFDPGYATATLQSSDKTKKFTKKAGISFTCLATADEEHLALTVKQQLALFGVEMKVEEASVDRINEAATSRDFDAILAPMISGPTLFRPYLWWHSRGPLNRTGYSSPRVDAALDTIRHARTDQEYRDGVSRFQQSIHDDPPAIFLAWDEHARAVSTKFDVKAEPGADILDSLRLWRPVGHASGADKN